MDWENLDESDMVKRVDILERELSYYKGQLKYLVGKGMSDDDCEKVLVEYYLRPDEK